MHVYTATSNHWDQEEHEVIIYIQHCPVNVWKRNSVDQ